MLAINNPKNKKNNFMYAYIQKNKILRDKLNTINVILLH